VIPAQRNLRWHTDDTPPQGFNLLLTQNIASRHIGEVMDAAINFDNELARDDRKVDDVGADRMLAPDRKSEITQ